MLFVLLCRAWRPLALLPIVRLVLTRLAFPTAGRMVATLGRDIPHEPGPMSSGARRTAAIFALAALLWMGRPAIVNG